MINSGLEEAQAGIKISGRNINKFRYANNTTLMAESEEELKSLLMKVTSKISFPDPVCPLKPHRWKRRKMSKKLIIINK